MPPLGKRTAHFYFSEVIVLEKDLETLLSDALNSKPVNMVKNAYKESDAKKKIDRIKNTVKEDIQLVKDRDPAARSSVEVALLYSGLHAVWAHRLSHKLFVNDHKFAARLVSQAAKAVTGIEIHPGAKIGKGLFIDHGSGVVIGETAEIGDYCTLYQGVTLGGTGKDVGKRHPTLGNDVLVGAGAKVLGPFKVGDGSRIAANAVVLKEVPENSTAVGIPAIVVRRKQKRVFDDLDQIHIPDPVSATINKLESELDELKEKVATLEAEKAEAEAKKSKKKPAKKENGD